MWRTWIAFSLTTFLILFILPETALAQNRLVNRRPNLSCSSYDRHERTYTCQETDRERLERSIRRSRPIAGPASCSGEGDFELKFQSRFRMDLYYNNEHIGRFGPQGCYLADYPEPGTKYEAYLLIPNEDGGISSVKARRIPGDIGLTFTDPETGKGKK